MELSFKVVQILGTFLGVLVPTSIASIVFHLDGRMSFTFFITFWIIMSLVGVFLIMKIIHDNKIDERESQNNTEVMRK